MNETKDKVRYLESLKRHLDQLYTGKKKNKINVKKYSRMFDQYIIRAFSAKPLTLVFTEIII